MDFVRHYESPYPATPSTSISYWTLSYDIKLFCYISHEPLPILLLLYAPSLSPFFVPHLPPLFLLRPLERLYAPSP